MCARDLHVSGSGPARGRLDGREHGSACAARTPGSATSKHVVGRGGGCAPEEQQGEGSGFCRRDRTRDPKPPTNWQKQYSPDLMACHVEGRMHTETCLHPATPSQTETLRRWAGSATNSRWCSAASMRQHVTRDGEKETKERRGEMGRVGEHVPHVPPLEKASWPRQRKK